MRPDLRALVALTALLSGAAGAGAGPADGNLNLALIEHPATGAPVLGDIVMNPGGPGESGVQFLQSTVESGSFPPGLTDHFNHGRPGGDPGLRRKSIRPLLRRAHLNGPARQRRHG
jgi:hypothetical protein